MRWNKLLILAILVVLCMMLSHALAEEKNTGNAVFTLPSSLRIIEESAFENTVPTTIYLPDSTEYIGDRAFAGSQEMEVIYIPKTVEYIGEEAFAGRDNLLIVGIRGTYAEDWAKRHGYRFRYLDVWATDKTEHGQLRRRTERILSYNQAKSDNMARAKLFIVLFFVFFSLNPKDKPEYYPIDYDFP